MPRSEANDKAIKKYNENFDRISLRFHKEQYELYRAEAEKRGMSFQAYVNKLLEES